MSDCSKRLLKYDLLICNFRDAVDLGDDFKKAVKGHNCIGQWRCSAGLSNEGGLDGDAPRRREKQSGGGENASRARGQSELQGYEGPDAALLQRHLQNRSDALRNVASRSRDDRSAGSPGLAGSSSGFFPQIIYFG